MLEQQPLPETERAMLRRQVVQLEQLSTAIDEFDKRMAGRALNECGVIGSAIAYLG